MKAIVVLLVAGFAWGVFQTPPDVWGEHARILKKQEEIKKRKMEEKRKFEERRNYFKQLYRETMAWLPEPEKVPPVLREVWKHPEDEELRRFAAKTMHDWTKKVERLSEELGWEYSRYMSYPVQSQTLEEEIKNLVKKGLSLIYFYSPKCVYCRMSDPVVNKLERLGVKVFRVKMEDYGKDRLTTVLIDHYGVRQTPTTIWYFEGGEGFKYVGVITEPVVLRILRYMKRHTGEVKR